MSSRRREDAARGQLVIIPGGSTQATHPAPAAELYRGAYHMACRRAALALTGPAGVLVLSPKHGFVRLDDIGPFEPYKERMPTRNYLCDPGGHQRRARGYAAENGLLDESPVVLGGAPYWRVCWSIWPGRIIRPLVAARNIADQIAVLRAIESTATLPRLERAG